MLNILYSTLFYLCMGFVSVNVGQSISTTVDKEKNELKVSTKEANGLAWLKIDMLHKEIQEKIDYLKTKKAFEKDDQGNEVLKYSVGTGEQRKSDSERYYYNSDIYLNLNSEGKMQSIRIRFDTLSLHSIEFEEERKEIINKTPLFTPPFDILDRNDDIEVSYFKNNDPNNSNFNLITSSALKDIQFYHKRTDLIYVYTKYLIRFNNFLTKEFKAAKNTELYLLGKVANIR